MLDVLTKQPVEFHFKDTSYPGEIGSTEVVSKTLKTPQPLQKDYKFTSDCYFTTEHLKMFSLIWFTWNCWDDNNNKKKCQTRFLGDRCRFAFSSFVQQTGSLLLSLNCGWQLSWYDIIWQKAREFSKRRISVWHPCSSVIHQQLHLFKGMLSTGSWKGSHSTSNLPGQVEPLNSLTSICDYWWYPNFLLNGK